MKNNIINALLSIDKAEQAYLSVSATGEGAIRVALTHLEASVSFYFSTPADAWRFGQAVAAQAEKLMMEVIE